MTSTHRTYDSIDDVDPVAWDACIDINAEIFARREFLRAVQRSMTDAEFQYVMFFNSRSEPVATAALCLYTVDMALLAEGALRGLAKFVARLVPSLIHVPVVLCGLPVSAGQNHLRIRPGTDVPEVVRQLDTILTEWAKRRKAVAVVFKEFDAAQCSRISSIAALGYRRADSLPMNPTNAGLAGFEEFVGKLKSRQRYPIRKAQQKFQASGLTILQKRGGDGVAEMFSDQVHELYLAVLERAEVRFEVLPAEYFRELARQLPDNSWFTFVIDESQSGSPIIAFASSVFSRKSYHQMFVGVRYDLKSESDLYFNLFFHAIDAAFQKQTDEIHVGQSADEFKRQKFRCWQQPLYFYVKPIRLAARIGMELAFDSFFPPHPARPRDEPA
ncbi:MAG: GNAT family N-acetyltransferase [Planctomycetota bacterium]|nr:GNAT family N-acetyltransferase [Planctomycetota bacterium]